MPDEFKIRIGAELDQSAGKKIQDDLSKVEVKPIEIPFKIDFTNSREIEKEAERLVKKITDNKGTLIKFDINKDTIFDEDLGKRVERLQGITLKYKNAIGEVVTELYKLRQIDTKTDEQGQEQAIMGWAKAYSSYSQNIEQSNKALLKQQELIEQMKLLQIRADKSGVALSQENITGFDTAKVNNNLAEMAHYLNLARIEYSQLNAMMEKDLPMNALEQIRNNISLMPIAIQNVETNFQRLIEQPEELKNKLENLNSSYQQLANFTGSDEEKVKQYNKLKNEIKAVTQEVKSLIKVQQQQVSIDEKQKFSSSIIAWSNENTKAAKLFRNELERIQLELQSADKTKFTALKKEFQSIQKQAEAFGVTGKTIIQEIVNNFQKFGMWYSLGNILVSGVHTIKDMINNVVELDTSLVELQKVSDLTGQALDSFIDKAYNLGSQIARTGQDVIQATTEFKRAGYTLDESFKLAEAALVMTNVGDGIKTVEAAASSLIATLKGFNLSAIDAMKVVDMINETSNNAAIDFDNITEGLRRVSGTLSQTGASIEQTIGLITGGFARLRDVEMVSSGKYLAPYVQKCA